MIVLCILVFMLLTDKIHGPISNLGDTADACLGMSVVPYNWFLVIQ